MELERLRGDPKVDPSWHSLALSSEALMVELRSFLEAEGGEMSLTESLKLSGVSSALGVVKKFMSVCC